MNWMVPFKVEKIKLLKNDQEELFHIFTYSENQYREIKIKEADEIDDLRDSQSITWINVDGICQENILTKIDRNLVYIISCWKIY